MQATMNTNALAPSLRLQFARRGYMVRSEKRRRPSPNPSSNPGNRQRPPRKRRPRAGFFYKFFMVILLLTLWPFGLLMLWSRRLRWGTLTKIFTMIVTLMAAILLIGTALTLDIQHPQLKAAQSSINVFLDAAADSLVDFSAQLGKRVERSLESLDELNLQYRRQSLIQMADTIDRGVEIAQGVRESLGIGADNPDAEKEPVKATDDAPGAETPDDAETGAEAPAPTSVPAAEIEVNSDSEELPVYIPETTPEIESGTAVISGMLSRAGVLEETALPTPTPEPTPEILRFALKPAAEAVVYFNIGSGKYYHMAKTCGSMKNADSHTFAETADNIHEPCERCNPPAKALLDETYIVWLDENDTAHLSDECAEFEGQWSIVSADAANEAEYSGCAACEADRYLKALKDGKTVELDDAQPEPTPEATSKATAKATPKSSAKPAADDGELHA